MSKARMLLLAAVSFSAPAIATEFSGYIAAEGRGFPHSARYPSQSANSASVAANLEYYHDWDNQSQRLAITGFGRLDSADSERSHIDIRELYWWKELESTELYIGIRKLFWGVTETVHLVDVINQEDLIENIDGEDKLGQPMVSLLLERDWGTLELFGLVGFRERTFPGADGRLRGSIPVDADAAIYQSSEGQDHIDLAIRWSQVIGDTDIGIAHFSGTSRDPVFIPDTSEGELTRLRPLYQQIDQTGMDIQATVEDWLWKLEAISIKYQDGGRQTALVGGFEYTLYGIAGAASDIGLLVEYQFDDRTGLNQTTTQNDLALGARWVLNDVQSTEVLAALSVDLDNKSRFISVEASRRLTDHWSVDAELRIFSNMDKQDPGFMLRDDDYFQLELKRYF